MIGTTVSEKLREHVLDLDFIIPLIRNDHNLHCLSCITYDILSTSILIYVITYQASGEITTINRLAKVEKLANLRKLVGKALWVILFVLTKNVENAI
jgi:hypothetical protein